MTAALGATTAWSQTGTEETTTTTGGGLQEVTITAEFRATNLQETPIAITAVNAEMLEQRSQTSIYELTAQAPNVVLAPQGQANGSGIIAFIRGVGQTDFNFALEPGVGIYIDDVYYSTLTGSLVDLLDLERVEVLRGPQGTLAGRNSIGGAIKLFSQKPRGNNTGSVSLTYGSYDRVDVRGVADFSIIDDKLLARVSGVTKSRDGYVDRVDYACTHPNSGLQPLNVGMGCKLGTLGGQAYTAGRASFRWLASDNIELNVIADITNDNSEAGADVLRRVNTDGATSWLIQAPDDGDPNTPPVVYDCRFVPYGPHSCDPNGGDPYLSYATFLDTGLVTDPGTPLPFKPAAVPPIQQLDQYGISAALDWNLGELYSLKSITAWRRYDSSWAQDADGSPLPSQQLLQTLVHWQWSQELRFNGTLPAANLDYTIGAFYFKQGGTLEARVDLNYAHIDFVHGPDTTPSESRAAFVHGTFHLTDAMNLSAGVRYSKDEKEYTYFRRNPDLSIPFCVPPAEGEEFNPFGPDQPTNCALSGLYDISDRFEGDRVDWRLALDYRWSPDFMTYAQISTGYKGGGVNPRPFFGPSTPEINQLKSFEPETLTTYEIGFKSDLLQNRMRLNTSLFYNQYEDIILTSTACPIRPCLQPNNVGEATVKGIEVETEIHPTDRFLIDGSVSYLDFQYDETNFAVTSVSRDMITPYTPEWKASLGAQYTFRLNERGDLIARIDGTYTSKVFGDAVNAPTNQIDGYTIANARLTWRAADERWQAALEVLNLTDKLYYHSVFDQAGSSGSVSYNPALPRTWAVTLKHNFGP